MTIHFMGSDPALLGGDPVLSPITDTAEFDTAYSRCAVHTTRASPVAVSVPSELPCDATGWWVAFYFHVQHSFYISGADYSFLSVFDGADTLALELDCNNGAVTMRLHTADGSADSASSIIELGVGASVRIAAHCYQDGADVRADLYSGGGLVGTAVVTGSTGGRALRRIKIESPDDDPSEHDAVSVSEVIIADHDIRNTRVKTIPLANAGTHQEWSGDLADIAGPDPDGLGIQGAVGDRASYNHGGVTGHTVQALAVGGALGAGDGAKVQGLLRIGGSDYAKDLEVDPGSGPAAAQAIWHSSPATAAAFTPSEVSALEAGVQVASDP